ncbi:MAG: hypothetical protein RSE41_06000 [Clostridia bacterium]
MALECQNKQGRIKCDESQYSGRITTNGRYKTKSGETISPKVRGGDKIYKFNDDVVKIDENDNVYINNEKQRCRHRGRTIICND